MNDVLKGVSIARVSTVSFFIETQLHSQLDHLVKSGASVVVVATESELKKSIPGIQYASIRIERKISIFWDLYSIVRLAFLFWRNKIDVVHSTTPKAGLVCAIAGWLARVPVRLHTYTGQVWVGNKGMKAAIVKLADKIIYLLNTACYADSRSQAEFLLTEKVAEECVGVLGHGSLAGVDTFRFNARRFDRAELAQLKSDIGISVDDSILIFVGRINWDKGVRELILAFSMLQKKFPVSLLMVGPAEVDIQSYIASQSSLDRSKIFFTGFSETPEKYLALSDLLVLPSYREGFGTSIIEAAAMGVPAVGSNIYGLRDSIDDGRSGILVPVRDVNALYQAIESLLGNATLLREMSVYAKRRARRLYSASVVSEFLIEDYLRLCAAYIKR